MTTPREVTENFVQAWASGDIAAARALVHDNLSFVGPIDTFNTADEHLAALQRVSQIVTGLDIRLLIGNGEDIVIIYDLVTNTPVGTSRIAEWKKIRDGKIAEIRAYFDSHPWRALGF